MPLLQDFQTLSVAELTIVVVTVRCISLMAFLIKKELGIAKYIRVKIDVSFLMLMEAIVQVEVITILEEVVKIDQSVI